MKILNDRQHGPVVLYVLALAITVFRCVVSNVLETLCADTADVVHDLVNKIPCREDVPIPAKKGTTFPALGNQVARCGAEQNSAALGALDHFSWLKKIRKMFLGWPRDSLGSGRLAAQRQGIRVG
jgi:hypothetical protein